MGPPANDSYKWVALTNTTAAMFMAALDGSIVLIAMPAIFRGIHLDPLAHHGPDDGQEHHEQHHRTRELEHHGEQVLGAPTSPGDRGERDVGGGGDGTPQGTGHRLGRVADLGPKGPEHRVGG